MKWCHFRLNVSSSWILIDRSGHRPAQAGGDFLRYLGACSHWFLIKCLGIDKQPVYCLIHSLQWCSVSKEREQAYNNVSCRSCSGCSQLLTLAFTAGTLGNNTTQKCTQAETHMVHTWKKDRNTHFPARSHPHSRPPLQTKIQWVEIAFTFKCIFVQNVWFYDVNTDFFLWLTP